MRVAFFGLIVCLLASCGSQTSGDAAPQADGVHGNAPQTTGGFSDRLVVLEGCYEMTLKRDTATLSLHLQDSIVTGNLRYNWYEKDDNTGTIKGVLRDSLIFADYTFESEGLTSVREVIFKIQEDGLLQASGELEDRNGKIVFRNPSSLQYTYSSPFVKVACP